MSALTELRDRLAKATGPDRLLDACLDIVLSLSRPAWANDTGQLTVDGDCVRISPTGAGWYPARFTASLDAAMTLVPEDHFLETFSQQPGQWYAQITDKIEDEKWFGAHAATGPLALCRARIEYELAKAAREPASRGEADSNHPDAFPNGRWG